MFYYFGVEIEIIAEPHEVQSSFTRAFYYEELAKALRRRYLRALADTLTEGYRKHEEYYDRWWITKDGSLKKPQPPAIPLEAVSPILSTRVNWEVEINDFWAAFLTVFCMPYRSHRCGSHIHISPEPEKQFSLLQLRRIAFGVIFYEHLVKQLLPECRRDNEFCQLNTRASHYLESYDLTVAWHLKYARDKLWKMNSAEAITRYLQGAQEQQTQRNVLWNFENTCISKSGSIEFRGGRGLRGSKRTKRWIAFVISFINLCMEDQSFEQMIDFDPVSMESFWRSILSSAKKTGVRAHLPENWDVMHESKCSSAGEDVSRAPCSVTAAAIIPQNRPTLTAAGIDPENPPILTTVAALLSRLRPLVRPGHPYRHLALSFIVLIIIAIIIGMIGMIGMIVIRTLPFVLFTTTAIFIGMIGMSGMIYIIVSTLSANPPE